MTAVSERTMTTNTSSAKRSWSLQQQDIFGWFRKSTIFLGEQLVETFAKHLIVRARAGTGKTTTIIEGVNQAPESNILLAAFNKRIAEELQGRITNPNAQAKTLHAVGYAAVRRFWEGLRICSGSERADALTETVCGPRCPDAIKKLVSRLHSKGREIVPHATLVSHIIAIAETFECEPDEQWRAEGFTLEYVCEKALAAMELATTVKPVKTGIDFADMIFLPVRNGWLTKTYDLVVVDEAQDMTTAQLEIAEGVCKGRICVVGDDRQAIYGFRGADSSSLDRLKAKLDAAELGLTTTYRCGRSIVSLAASLVPDFNAAPTSPEGTIKTIHSSLLTAQAAAGDFILSRLNAPLVSVAMALLRSGKRTRVAGRDIGAGLKALVRKMAKGRAANSVPEFLAKVSTWEMKETDRLMKAKRTQDRIDAIHDQAEMLIGLADGADSVDHIVQRIEALFTDDGLGQAGVITCSSVHRAKGLEADTVYILRDTLRDKTQEELNIQYVAITRAKSTLVFVSENVPVAV